MPCDAQPGLWHPGINHVALFRRLQKIRRHCRRELSDFGPLTKGFVVPTFVLRVEIYKCRREACIVPHLAQEPQVWFAHQLLAEDIQAVCWTRSIICRHKTRHSDLHTCNRTMRSSFLNAPVPSAR